MIYTKLKKSYKGVGKRGDGQIGGEVVPNTREDSD